MTRRVVVTGASGLSPIGNDWKTVVAALRAGRSGIVAMPEWSKYEGLATQLGGQVPTFTLPEHFTRKRTRSMGRVSLMAVLSAERALAQAGVERDDPILTSGKVGVAYGSSTGSTDAVMDFAQMVLRQSLEGLTSTTYIRMMPHTTAVNLAVYFGLKGRVITTSSACTSGSQGIGYAYEAIRFGKQNMMIAGGGEELCPTEAAVFDVLGATSTRNDTPTCTPRPYDVARDGLVVGEGAATLILEELDHALARGAAILAELVGFGTNCDGAHVTQPNAETMQVAMTQALEDAQLPASAIGYVNGHGTATDRGDIAETIATASTYGCNTPMASFKGHTGHTLGACGALEAWWSIEMLNEDWYAPTLNLENIDPRCADLDFIIGAQGRSMQNEYVVSNNFAFGGINTSLIFRRWH